MKLKRFSEGVWFNHPEGGRFKVRPIFSKDYLEIRELCKKGKIAVPKPPDGKIEIVDDYDDAKILWMVFDLILQDWQVEIEGATSKVEEKEVIYNEVSLHEWIVEKSKEITAIQEEKFEGELKNFESLQSG